MRIGMDEQPLDSAASVARSINDVKQSKPDPGAPGLLIRFKHSHFARMDRILKEVKIPTVIFSCLCVKPGPINSRGLPGSRDFQV